MKTAIAILALLVCWRPGAAQTKDDDQLAPNIRLYHPKNMSVQRAYQVAEFVNSVLGPRTKVSWDDVPHSLVIRASDPADMDAAEALLKRFDLPESTKTALTIGLTTAMDCTVYLIRASMSPPAPRFRGGVPITIPIVPVPAELQSAVDEMKHSFGYDNYSLWDTQVLHSGSSGADLQGILPLEGTGNAHPYVYSMSYASTYVAPDKTLVLQKFEFSVRMPSNLYKEGIESHIRSQVSIHEGQKLVLGKIRLMPEEHADLFLVLATKPH